MSTLPPIAQIVREMLKQVADPGSCEQKKILAMTRSRYSQIGGDPNKVKQFHVNDTLVKLRRKLKKPITKEGIMAVEKSMVKMPGRIPLPSTNGHATPPAIARMQTPGLTLEGVRAAKAFVSSCGGFGPARELLDILEEAAK